MNKLKYLLLLIVGATLFVSCGDDDSLVSDIEDGSNLVLFSNNSQSVSNIANGDEYQVDVPIKVEGPSVSDLSGDIDVTVEPVYESPGDTIPADNRRAIAGTHYRLNNNTITLTESNNYLGKITFTMLTQGVEAPLTRINEEGDTVGLSPSFKLMTTEVSGGGNVINSGKPINISLNYSCPSFLEGVYNVTVNHPGGQASFSNVNVVSIGVGQYDTNLLGEFGPAHQPPNNFTRGIEFQDVCGEVTVPSQTLAQFSNAVEGVSATQVVGNSQQEGGVESFTLEYSIDGYGSRTSTYTYVGPLPE